MVVQIQIDSATGDVATRAFIASSDEHADAARMLERLAPNLEALQDVVLSSAKSSLSERL